MENQLVAIEDKSVVEAFSSPDGLSAIIGKVKDAVSSFDHDLSTVASRKRTASLANKVAKIKVRLDDMGKQSVADYKAKVKLVDSHRKAMRDELDALKVEARKPLTEWEEEQKRIEAEETAKKLQEEIDRDHEFALLMNADFDREIEANRKAEEEAERKRIEEEQKAQAEREERMRKEAAEKARIEAEQKALAEKERIEREKKEAEERAAKAERDKIAVEERAKAQAELAEKQKVEAAERARQEEINRQEREKEIARIEQEKREANKRHVGAVRKSAKEALMKYVDEETARKIVLAINNGEIPAVSIAY